MDQVSINPQDSQDSVTAELRRLFPGVLVIEDGLIDDVSDKIKTHEDGTIVGFICIWFRIPTRTAKGRSFSSTRLDQRKVSCDIAFVGRSGSEARRALNRIYDNMINFKPVRSGRMTESDALFGEARSIDIANRPTRWVAQTSFEWRINHERVY